MGKLKKKLKRKVNPEKSNKMIIAVAAGLILVFGALFLLTLGPSKPENKPEAMKEALAYLENSEGIKEIKTIPESNTVIFVYEGYQENLKDYKNIAWKAGMRVSYFLGNETVTVKVCKDSENDVVTIFEMNNKTGKVVK